MRRGGGFLGHWSPFLAFAGRPCSRPPVGFGGDFSPGQLLACFSHAWHTVQVCLQLLSQGPFLHLSADPCGRQAGGLPLPTAAHAGPSADPVSVFGEDRAGLHKVGEFTLWPSVP